MKYNIHQQADGWPTPIQFICHICSLLCTLLPCVWLGIEHYDNNQPYGCPFYSAFCGKGVFTSVIKSILIQVYFFTLVEPLERLHVRVNIKTTMGKMIYRGINSLDSFNNAGRTQVSVDNHILSPSSVLVPS